MRTREARQGQDRLGQERRGEDNIARAGEGKVRTREARRDKAR